MDEITQEYAAQQLLPEIELKAKVSATVAAKTDLGRVRENNEDKFEYFVPTDVSVLAARGQVYLVCDGMGGHNAGQIASELAIKTFLGVYLSHPSPDAEVAARSAVDAANRFVKDVGDAVPGRRGMGTTLVGLIFIQDQAMVINVGDSRVYRLRAGTLEAITLDHSWVEESVRAGLLSREDAENHPYKNVITRAFGTHPTVEPDVTFHAIEAGDVFLLCSDGLTNHVRDAELESVLSEFGPGEACMELVKRALADGGSDNCTAMVVQVNAVERL